MAKSNNPNDGVEVLRLGPGDNNSNPQNSGSQYSPPQSQSWAQWLGESAVGLGKAALRGAEAAINLPDTLGNLVAAPISNAIFNVATGNAGEAQKIQQDLQQKGVFNPESSDIIEQAFGKNYGNPKNPIESGLQQGAEILGSSLIGGMSPKAALSRAGRGAAVMGTIGAAGGGPTAQLVGDLASEYFSGLRKSGGTPMKLFRNYQENMKTGYDNAKKIGRQYNFPAKNYSDSVEDLIDSLRHPNKNPDNLLKGLTKDQRKSLLDEAKDLQNLIKIDPKTGDKTVNLASAVNAKQNYNKIGSKTSDADVANAYYKFADTINKNVIYPGAEKFPDFGKSFLPAEATYKALEVHGPIREMFERATDLKKIVKNPETVAGLLGAGFIFGAKKIAKTATGAYLGRYLARANDLFRKHPDAVNKLQEIAMDALRGDEKQFSSHVNQLDELISSYSK